MGQTTKHGLRYPENTDLVKDTATYMKNLAEDTDTALTNQIIQESGSAKTTNTYSASAMNNKIKTNIITDAESETNEYIDDKQVFVKRINIGSLPNADTINVKTGLINSEITVVKLDGIAKYSSGATLTLPASYPNLLGGGIWLATSSSTEIEIQITTGSDRSEAIGYVNIYYTKN